MKNKAKKPYTIDFSSPKDRCPFCGVTFKGDLISEDIRKYYGSTTHYDRKISIYSRDEDKTVAWKCPDCSFVWSAT